MSSPERRYLTRQASKLELRAQQGKPTIEGYAIVFNSVSLNLGGFRELVLPGATTESLKTADVRCLIDHEPCKILGRNTKGTLRLTEDDHGLKISDDLPDTSYARDLLEIMSPERQDVDGMSFGFNCLDEEWTQTEDGIPLRRLIKIELFDVSVVTYPAYPSTEVALRSLRAHQVGDAKRRRFEPRAVWGRKPGR